MDLRNNDVTVAYSGANPIGAWNGSAYSGLLGAVQTHAIFTSTGAGVGIAEIGGEVMIRAVRPGDADLDGVINGDDFFAIDANAGQVGGDVSYANGDFDYNGRVDADDYFLIDSNYNKGAIAPGATAASAGAELPSRAIFAGFSGVNEEDPLLDELV
jgi:hypothetical protein